MDTDRNLLFGVLAMQADLIGADQFAEACSAWAAKKTIPLANLIQERGWITAEDRADVEKLLERKLKRHGGDVHASLADVAGSHVRGLIAAADDFDLQQSMAGLAVREGPTLVSTRCYESDTRERYTLTRPLDQGGIGQVWVAYDGDLGRPVALKELRPDRAGEQEHVARFVEEAKITGQLEHPNIVPVYELARRAADGQPFYTMRFIKGRELSEAIRAYHARREAGEAGALDLAGLLNAFVAVCNAVAYAHARGVLHRDLKPRNVVLGDFGEVIVLDWGLAKLVGRIEKAVELESVALQAVDSHEATLPGQVLGTPGYLAPEQAEGRLEQVDRRTDIYGLGATLYAILTGHAPFEGPDSREVLRRVVHEPPARPRSLVSSTPAALEAVCLKALAKAPGDRYGSAAELADEVRHYLADEPVTAHREPLPVRAGRWMRRHRTLTTAGAAVGLVALVLSLVGYSREVSYAARLAAANTEAQRQRDEARRQRDLADANFAKARTAVDDYLTTVSESTLLKSPLPGLQPLRKQLLESALGYYREFMSQHRDDPELKAHFAAAAYRAGKITAEIGKGQDAVPALEQARDLYEELVRLDRNPARQHELAMTHNEIGKLLFSNGRKGEALRAFQRANDIELQLLRDRPTVAEYQRQIAWTHNNIGVIQLLQGELPASEQSFKRAIAVWTRLARDHPSVGEFRSGLARSSINLGDAQHFSGNLSDALSTNAQAVAVMRNLTRDHPESATYQRDLARNLYNLGRVHYYIGQTAEALRCHQEAVSVSRELVRSNPTVTDYLATLGFANNLLGHLHVDADRCDDALHSFREVLDLANRATLGNPDDENSREVRADALLGIGRIHRKRGQATEALDSFRESIAVVAKLTDDPERLHTLACAQAQCSGVLGEGKSESTPAKRAEAEQYAAESVATLRRASQVGWRNVPWLKRDPALDPLRSREDFKRLIHELEKAQAATMAAPELPHP